MKTENLTDLNMATAVAIDLRSSLAFGRAALKGVATLSPQAKQAVLTALDEEASAVELDDSPGSAAVAAVISEQRRRLAEG